MICVPLVVVMAILAAQDAPAGKPPDPPRSGAKVTDGGSAPAPAATPPAGKPQSASAQKAEKRRAKKPAQSSVTKADRAKKEAASRSQPTRPSDDDELHVRTQAEMRKPRSPFVVAPGEEPSDRYGPQDMAEWDNLPEWRRASFFGIRARGLFFIYVVDCSGSMIDDDRLPRATIELRRSVFALKEPQKFEVIFYNEESIPMPGGPIPRTADLQTKNLLMSWLRLIEPDGGTAPLPSMKQALSLRPDAVFLLSDGAFPDGTDREIARFNARKIPIHCIDLTGGLAGDQLKRIAAASGGKYASKPGDLQAHP